MSAGEALKKNIGFWSATAIVIGSIIGSGVFMKPATMAAQTSSPVWLLLIWVIAGLFSLFGALINAEVGAMFPKSGGHYVYLKYMYNDLFGFLYGWAGFAVINTAAVASISFVCAEYADYFLHLPRFSAETEKSLVFPLPFIGKLYPLQNFGVKLIAIALTTGITYINYRSAKAGTRLQVVTTIIKLVVIGALIFGIFFSGNGNVENFWTPSSNPKQSWQLLGGLIAALTGAFMAYDGWINVNFVAGEIKEPNKNIPRSLLIGVFVCMIVYVLVNQAYLYVLPVDQMAGSSLVASDAIAIALGKTSSAIVAALIIICTFGAVNGNILASARVTYAMGSDKLFFRWTGKTHSKYKTPGNALWLHGIWAIVLILSGSFDMLADMFTFIAWVVYLFGAIGIIILRKKYPDLPRPYKVWGYPYVPILFIAFASFYVVSTIWNDTLNFIDGNVPVINSILGLMITALGIPLYYFFKAKYRNEKQQ